MAQGHAVSLLIALPPEQTQLSKAQKTFNTLVQKIEKRRSELLRWQSAVEQSQKKYCKILFLWKKSTMLHKSIWCMP